MCPKADLNVKIRENLTENCELSEKTEKKARQKSPWLGCGRIEGSVADDGSCKRADFVYRMVLEDVFIVNLADRHMYRMQAVLECEGCKIPIIGKRNA